MYKGANTGPKVRVNSHINVQSDHGTVARAVARAVAREGVVMVKNEGNALPLSASSVIRVFGSDAGPSSSGPNACADSGCNNGVLGMGWGVST